MATIPNLPHAPIPYFGRVWQLTITPQVGGLPLVISNVETENLHVTFDAMTVMMMAYQFATVVIYNAPNAPAKTSNPATKSGEGQWLFTTPITAGDAVTLAAGYSHTAGPGAPGDFNPSHDFIFRGNVVQAFWTRENVVDWKLTLRLALGMFQDALAAVSLSIPGATTPGKPNADANDFKDICAICASVNPPIQTDIDTASQQILSAKTYSSGRVFKGRPFDLIKDITDQYKGKIYPWPSNQGLLTIRTFDPAKLPTPAFAYGPINTSTYTPQSARQVPIKTTLIGTPEQTQSGILFRVLLDSSIQIGQTIELAQGVLFNLFPFQPGQGRRPPLTNTSGIYVVAGIRHYGDSRGGGDDWFTEITGNTAGWFDAWQRILSATHQGGN